MLKPVMVASHGMQWAAEWSDLFAHNVAMYMFIKRFLDEQKRITAVWWKW